MSARRGSGLLEMRLLCIGRSQGGRKLQTVQCDPIARAAHGFLANRRSCAICPYWKGGLAKVPAALSFLPAVELIPPSAGRDGLPRVPDPGYFTQYHTRVPKKESNDPHDLSPSVREG